MSPPHPNWCGCNACETDRMREDERTRKLADGSHQGDERSPVKPVTIANGSGVSELPTKAELLEAWYRGSREGTNEALRGELAEVRKALRAVLGILDDEKNAYRTHRDQQTITTARARL